MALTNWQTLVAQLRTMVQGMGPLMLKGQGDNNLYALEVNQTTGELPVAGTGSAGTAATGVVTVQGIAGGTSIPISGAITATNASIGATGAAVPASATYLGVSVAGTMTGVVATANGVKTDGSGVTQPVSGTVTANAGSGTLAVSAVALPLPAGAATAAKQPALGTAGAAAADVISVQGIAGGTALPASQSGTWTVQPGNTANTTPWLATIAQGGNSATVSAGGALKVDGSAATQPVSGTITANAGSGTFATDPAQTNVGSNGAVGSVTGSALTGAYATVVTPGFISRVILIFNSCDKTIKVSLDGGVTDFFILEAGESATLDLGASGRKIAASVNLQAKHNGAAPTSGTIRITAIG